MWVTSRLVTLHTCSIGLRSVELDPLANVGVPGVLADEPRGLFVPRGVVEYEVDLPGAERAQHLADRPCRRLVVEPRGLSDEELPGVGAHEAAVGRVPAAGGGTHPGLGPLWDPLARDRRRDLEVHLVLEDDDGALPRRLREFF